VQVACMQLGYTMATNAVKVDNAGIELATGTIHLKDPACSPVDTSSMLQCGGLSGTCGHAKDVYITCGGMRLCYKIE
jgi:hypothetical protein